jgi:hypothetical protein
LVRLAICSSVLVTLVVLPPTAQAGPDLDGAVKSLASVPMDSVGDAFGGAGLAMAATVGFTGDIVAAVDNNEYSRIVLRGLLSTPIRRLALGLSRMSSGMLEGFSNADFEYYPEAEERYLKTELKPRSWTFRGGLGGIVLSAVDFFGNAGQFLLRAPGATATADSLEQMQSDARSFLVGPAQDGPYELGVLTFGQ